MKSKSVVEDRVELVGKRVGMMGSVWPGEDPDVKFYGVVTKKMKFKDRKGEMTNGYEVLWDDGERERWSYNFLFDALVLDEGPLIRSDDDSDDDTSDSDSDSDSSDSDVDVFNMMSERLDPEDREYREMFSTSHTGEDVVVPGDC